ncbi:MAG: hypothetical protein Q8L69_07210 [Gallionellaceae bacterium]|nr:hypothetical protein [Gallionellaceae bacterium]
MKPDINPIHDLNIRVIKPRLTQPEEIDQILMAVAARKSVAGASYGVVHRKPTSCLPDHYLPTSGNT